METHRLAKIAGFVLSVAIVGFYRRKSLMALSGSIAAVSFILSFELSNRLSEQANGVLSMCGVLFGLLTFGLWIRSSIQEQRKAESQQDH